MNIAGRRGALRLALSSRTLLVVVKTGTIDDSCRICNECLLRIGRLAGEIDSKKWAQKATSKARTNR